MDQQDIEQSLAELLGGEITVERRRQLEHALAQNPALHDELTDLQHVLEQLKAVPTVDIPQSRTPQSEQSPARRPRRIYRWTLGTLKYAAILMIGIGLGKALDDKPAQTAQPPQIAVPQPPDDAPPGIAPGWVQTAVEVTRDTGNCSSLLRQLRMLAAVKRSST